MNSGSICIPDERPGWTHQVLTGRKAKLRVAVGDFDMCMAEIYEGSSLDPGRRAAAA
jgi:hypothetical protein